MKGVSGVWLNLADDDGEGFEALLGPVALVFHVGAEVVALDAFVSEGFDDRELGEAARGVGSIGIVEAHLEAAEGSVENRPEAISDVDAIEGKKEKAEGVSGDQAREHVPVEGSHGAVDDPRVEVGFPAAVFDPEGPIEEGIALFGRRGVEKLDVDARIEGPSAGPAEVMAKFGASAAQKPIETTF